LGWRENGQPLVTRRVVIDVPNVAQTPTGCGFFGDCPPPPFSIRLSDSQALGLWNGLRGELGLEAVDAAGVANPNAPATVTFQMTPDQLYRLNGGTAVLECRQELPVVR